MRILIGILISALLVGALIWFGWVWGHPIWNPTTSGSAAVPTLTEPDTPVTTPKSTETPSNTPKEASTPTAEQPATPVSQTAVVVKTIVPADEPTGVEFISLNYDETNGDPLIPGQTRLIASYLRFDTVTKKPVTITQKMLEGAITAIQSEASATDATTFEGSILKLNQRHAWLVWCSDARKVDPPSDVSVVHEEKLLAPETYGRVWIQIPFEDGVPPRVDDTWQGCNSEKGFWAVAVH